MIEVAIIGPTASGKSEAAINLAQKYGAYILSLDSLSVYKEVDIASAKPSKNDLLCVRHFGIDMIYPDEAFNAAMFMDEYERAKSEALEHGKNLVIVGGSSFYLKAMMDGLTDMPPISEASRQKANNVVSQNTLEAYEYLVSIDQGYASNIKSSDGYRIGRGLEMFFEFGKPPSELFASLPKKAVAEGLKVYEITVDRDVLRARIALRTAKMFELGIVEEAEYLLSRYGRDTKPIGSIGLKETLSYIDGDISRQSCEELINIHTSQLAKRQSTFNKTQLSAIFRGEKDDVYMELQKLF